MAEYSSGLEVQSSIDIMLGVMENEGALLRKMLNKTEQITRETVNAEVESRNNMVAHKSLKDEITRLKSMEHEA